MISVKIDNSSLNAKLKKQTDALAKLPVQGEAKFKSLTPIKSGNARSRTNLSGDGRRINASYNYAQALEDNRSPQTRGQGMVRPFLTWWTDQINKIARMK